MSSGRLIEVGKAHIHRGLQRLDDFYSDHMAFITPPTFRTVKTEGAAIRSVLVRRTERWQQTVDCAKHRSHSHGAVIRVCDEADNVIKTHDAHDPSGQDTDGEPRNSVSLFTNCPERTHSAVNCLKLQFGRETTEPVQ